MGAPMLTSGRNTSSAQRERPMAKPIATPATAASAKPASRRTSVSSTWWGRTPSAVRRIKAAATSSSGGNRLGGEMARVGGTSQGGGPPGDGKAGGAAAPNTLATGAPRYPPGEDVGRCGGGKVGHGRTIVRAHRCGQAHSRGAPRGDERKRGTHARACAPRARHNGFARAGLLPRPLPHARNKHAPAH